MISPKLFLAEGGLKRMVWLSKMMKEEIKDKLIERCKAISGGNQGKGLS